MLGRRTFAVTAVAAALAQTAGRRAAAQTTPKTLRVVPQAEPQSFDPVFAQVNNVSCTAPWSTTSSSVGMTR